MEKATLQTEFLPAEKSDEAELKKQHEYFSRLELIKTFVNSVPSAVLVLNKNRQIVCANKTFLDSFSYTTIDDVIGSRPGDVFRCDHDAQSKFGCGTTKFCTVCGSAKAIYESQKSKAAIHECSISRQDADALDFEVWANPLHIDGELFTIYSILDKSDEKRRKALERIFFHDILNTAGGIRGSIELLAQSDPNEMRELAQLSYEFAERLIEEIEAQRELSHAENNELVMNPKPFSTFEILKEIRTLYLSHQVATNKNIVIDKDCVDEIITTDKATLRRVLGNLIKNALEAVNEKQTVTLNCHKDEDNYIFSVHNPTYISEQNQLQIFHRSFSSKGAGRGLGTYSIRLLTERYLKGKVSFHSTKEEGTTFYAKYPKELN